MNLSLSQGKPMRTRSMIIAATAFVGIAAAGTTIAADLPKEGQYEFTACQSGVFTSVGPTNTVFAASWEGTGSTMTTPPGGMFDRLAFHCVGYTTAFDGKAPVASNACVAVDKDGDKIFARFTPQGPGVWTRETVAGTGKYEGMMMSGTAVAMAAAPAAKPGTFQNCNRQTGTYKLK
jgi:hypothetical protein